MNSKKWSCEYCTYENWPKAGKCTLCRQPRPQQVITSETLPVENDIYKIAPAGCGSGSPSPTSEDYARPIASDPSSKWACQICTYLNWPRAIKCTQCLTPRPKVFHFVT